ncbi:MAG TPA: M20/M25/M40 family metallo-hydrolase, partial [Firmicutes bacterium]|nr:M20/M25/M40 family metallo-hydrolase [Bacillota bacterium]
EPVKGRGSFLARLGKGPRKMLLLSHLDVVPAAGNWDFDPFSGEITEDMVLGRGALDCKGLTSAQAWAVLQLAREGAQLNGQLIMVAAADEEMGGTLGIKYLAENFPRKLQADFAVNEGADLPVILNGRKLFFIQVGEKGLAWSKLKASGKSGHGAIPALGDNAVIHAARAVSALGDYRAEVKLIPEVQQLLQQLSAIKGLGETVTEQNVDRLLDRLQLADSFMETVRAMTRLTVSPNLIRGGNKTNIVPDQCEVELVIRILPGQDEEYVRRELRRYAGDNLEIETMEYSPPTFSTSESDFYRLMESVTSEIVGPEVICLPQISSGSTDSKFLRRIGIPAYGVGHMAGNYDPSIRTTVHGLNERIDLASLHVQSRFFYRLARKYLQA